MHTDGEMDAGITPPPNRSSVKAGAPSLYSPLHPPHPGPSLAQTGHSVHVEGHTHSRPGRSKPPSLVEVLPKREEGHPPNCSIPWPRPALCTPQFPIPAVSTLALLMDTTDSVYSDGGVSLNFPRKYIRVVPFSINSSDFCPDLPEEGSLNKPHCCSQFLDSNGRDHFPP